MEGIHRRATGGTPRTIGFGGVPYSLNSHPLRETIRAIHTHDPVHGGIREGPWIGTGAADNFDVRQGGDIEHDPPSCTAGREVNRSVRSVSAIT